MFLSFSTFAHSVNFKSELHYVILQLLFWTWHVLCAFCAPNYFLHFGVDPSWSFLIPWYWLLYCKPPLLYKHCLSLNHFLSFPCWEPLKFFFLSVLSRKPQVLHNCDNGDLVTRIVITSLNISSLTSSLKKETTMTKDGKDIYVKSGKHVGKRIFRKLQNYNHLQRCEKEDTMVPWRIIKWEILS